MVAVTMTPLVQHSRHAFRKDGMYAVSSQIDQREFMHQFPTKTWVVLTWLSSFTSPPNDSMISANVHVNERLYRSHQATQSLDVRHTVTPQGFSRCRYTNL